MADTAARGKQVISPQRTLKKTDLGNCPYSGDASFVALVIEPHYGRTSQWEWASEREESSENGIQKHIQKESEDRSLKVDPSVCKGWFPPFPWVPELRRTPKHCSSGGSSEQHESRTPIQTPWLAFGDRSIYIYSPLIYICYYVIHGNALLLRVGCLTVLDGA